MNSISKKSPKNKDFSAIFMSREELELLVTALADLLDEYVDAIMLAAVDEDFLTPLGQCKIHEGIAADLEKNVPCNCAAHRYEHSIEVQIPFIQFIDKDPRIVPIIMADQSKAAAEKLAGSIREACKGRDVIIIASSDMAHYIPKDDANKLNSEVLDRLRKKDVDGMYSVIEEKDISVCGFGPMATAILATEPSEIDILKYSDSWDSLRYDIRSVVGYGAAVMYR